MLDDKARKQALATATVAAVNGHVALMPDAHWGMGCTIGSVIPTRTAIIPSAVGVDIGCGVIASDTLGSGNHFLELCTDERNRVWLMLHTGSRGVGNSLALRHIESAKGLMKQYFIELPDPDLAYLVEGTAEFNEYVTDLQWAQPTPSGPGNG